jgi:predicted CXXCH cytochrome family protein
VNDYFLRLAPVVLCTGLLGLQAQPVVTNGGELVGAIHGPSTCSTSGCHGGATPQSRQFAIWSQRDVHSRSFNTLTSARSARMAEALQLGDPTKNASCTACHAPLQTVAPSLLAANARVEDGVSCVSCHGTATEDWLRSHTRPDWTHADRVAAGMKDLRNLYTRANNCVACHQNIDPQLVKVGHHPQLVFELDGQAASEPKHWREVGGWQGGQAWYVGQAVALRELSWALVHGKTEPELDFARWAGLLWVLQTCDAGESLPAFGSLTAEAAKPAYAAALETADAGARRAAGISWTPALTMTLVRKLAASHSAFLEKDTPQPVQARRAERLVLALDRLLSSMPAKERPEAAGAPLDRLFQLAQSVPDFAPGEFARALAAFELSLAAPAAPSA